MHPPPAPSRPDWDVGRGLGSAQELADLLAVLGTVLAVAVWGWSLGAGLALGLAPLLLAGTAGQLAHLSFTVLVSDWNDVRTHMATSRISRCTSSTGRVPSIRCSTPRAA
jgi:hypothetical protein